jgi:hypothetical protein
VNLVAEHYLRYAEQWFVLSLAGGRYVDKAFCEHQSWDCLLRWAEEKDEE